MKKTAKFILIVAVILLGVFALTACNNSGPTVNQRWADAESISFSIYDKNQSDREVGTATIATTTKLTQEEKDAVSGADTRVNISVTIDNVTTESVYYSHIYDVLTVKKVYTDADHPENNYDLTAKHSDKYYEYTLTYPNATDKNKSGKLNVGTSGYTDGEFLYMYVRCHDTSALPSSIKVADPFTDEVTTLACSLVSSKSPVNTQSSLGTVNCNEISIHRSSTPIGGDIRAYYLPLSEGTYGTGTIIKSSCFPVKIVENNLTYVLNGFEPSQKNG